jgi:hypothetical protein
VWACPCTLGCCDACRLTVRWPVCACLNSNILAGKRRKLTLPNSCPTTHPLGPLSCATYPVSTSRKYVQLHRRKLKASVKAAQRTRAGMPGRTTNPGTSYMKQTASCTCFLYAQSHTHTRNSMDTVAWTEHTLMTPRPWSNPSQRRLVSPPKLQQRSC